MSDLLRTLCDDLAAEGDALGAVLSSASESDFRTHTCCPGWDVAAQLAHLQWTDSMLLRSVTDPDGFAAMAAGMPRSIVDEAALEGSRRNAAACVDEWESSRRDVLALCRAVPRTTKVAWFGPPMSIATAVTARIMETFAHGHDITEALGAPFAPSSRLRHIADLAWRARHYSFAQNGLDQPAGSIQLEVTGVDGCRWTWGPDDSENRVTADALDFALLATRRRRRSESTAVAEGEDAERWLDIVQAYA